MSSHSIEWEPSSGVYVKEHFAGALYFDCVCCGKEIELGDHDSSTKCTKCGVQYRTTTTFEMRLPLDV